MKNYQFDVAVIGGGPAGLAAAVSAKEEGAERVVIIERDHHLGGILQQCIHPGFGLKYFDDELTGPEYAQRFIDQVSEKKIDTLLNTMVLSIEKDDLVIKAMSDADRVFAIKAGAIVLAMGCRERTRTALSLPGSRPAGIFTAGTAQRYINMQNYRVGNKVMILGSGDIGMIMARRLTLEGAEVVAVAEIMPYLAGLTRNRVQCLDDFGIPLLLEHTITEIKGNKRLESIVLGKVDENRNIIPGSEKEVECDTLLLSVGLIPENEISKNCGVEIDPVTQGPVVDHKMQTNIPGIFASGNVVHVNDLVDNVSMESNIAGRFAARFASNLTTATSRKVLTLAGEAVRYVVPQTIELGSENDEVDVYFRVSEPLKDVSLIATFEGEEILRRKRRIVNPGEMENLTIDTKNLKEDGTLSVSVLVGAK